MKRITLLISALLLLNFVRAQKAEELQEYTASNGITYKEGDMIQYNKGSGTDGKFVYLSANPAEQLVSEDQVIIGPKFRGVRQEIRKIKKIDNKRYTGVIFVMKPRNFYLYIENAIEACEVAECTKKDDQSTTKNDKYDQLNKLKKLLEDGTLTKEEFEAEKKKLLDGN